MRQVKSTLWLVFGVALLLIIPVAIILALAWGIKLVLMQFFALDPKALEVWLPTVGTLLGGGIGVMATKRLERKQDFEMRLREERSNLYEPVLRLLFRMLETARSEGVASLPERYGPEMLDSGRLLVMGGSDLVVRGFVKLQSFPFATGSLQEFADQVGSLMVTIRQDLGHNDTVDRSTVLKLFGLQATPSPSKKYKAGPVEVKVTK